LTAGAVTAGRESGSAEASEAASPAADELGGCQIEFVQWKKILSACRQARCSFVL